MTESRQRGTTVTRRTALKSFVGATGGAALAGAAPPVAAQSDDPDFGGWFDDVSNYDGVVDKTGSDTVEVTVGVQANDGNFGFGPAAIRVTPDTTVVWKWNGKGGQHNVVAEDGTFDSGDPVSDQGTTFEYTFESTGTYKYVCTPHEMLGMKGAVVVSEASGGQSGGSDGGGGGGTPDYGGWFSDVSNFDSTVDKRGQDSVTVTVGAAGNDGNFAFAPPAIHVDQGTTVVWKWNGKGGQHNVVAEDGTFDSGDPVSEKGTTFEHTFESDGIYKYVCTPHEMLGMKGAVVVGSDYPSTGGGDGGDGGGGGEGGDGDDGGGSTVEVSRPGPGIFFFGGSLLLWLMVPLFIGGYQRFKSQEPAGATATEESGASPGPLQTTEAPVTDDHVAEEIDHEEYDPKGTLALVLAYLVIVAVMWVFMYFVEFLGNGPTVIG